MTLSLDASSATMSVDVAGSASAIYVGQQLVLLHGTRNANLHSADSVTGGKTSNGPSITITGNVFMKADPTDVDTGDWQFGMIQVSNLMVYEFVYAGRRANEGSVSINLKSGYTKPLSLDAQPAAGVSIDDSIFDPSFLTTTRVTSPQVGFQIEYLVNDHPATLVPQRFQNRTTHAPNYLFSARRDEGFVTYFVARANKTAAVQFLSRVGWHAIWHGEFQWSVPWKRPTVIMKDSRLDLGTVLLGAPAATDSHFLIAQARVGPTANDQDNQATDDAFIRRNVKVCTQATTQPSNLPSNFFP
jgi:hypothetical protein